MIYAQQHTIQPKEPKYEAFYPLLSWIPTEIVKRTLMLRISMLPFLEAPPSVNTKNNVSRTNEPIATNTVFFG